MRARPLSRGFSKLLEGRWSRERGGAPGGAKGGAPLHKGRTRTGRALLPLGSLSSSSLALPLPLRSSALAVLEAESFSSFWSCARGLASGLSTEARTGDAAAPVVWWTCACGRGVPERVRRPRAESGPGATTPTVVGERTRRSLREVPTLFSGFCMDAVAPCPASRIV